MEHLDPSIVPITTRATLEPFRHGPFDSHWRSARRRATIGHISLNRARMRVVLAMALLAVSAAHARDFPVVPSAANPPDYSMAAKGFDAAFVARISRLERGAAPPAPVLLAHDRPILAGFALGEGPEFMKLANSLPTAACHPKASRGKRVQRNLGLAASDTSGKIGAACYQRF